MQQLILMLHVLIAVALIILVLVQQGKGAEMGAAFGSGASQTLFGSQGSGSFLLKVTAGLAALFFASSLLLGHLAATQTKTDPLDALSTIVKTQSAAPDAQIPKGAIDDQDAAASKSVAKHKRLPPSALPPTN